MSLEALAAAGLYDPDAPNAAERREHLEYLLERFSLEEILGVDVTHQFPITDILAVLNGERVEHLSAVEVAAQTGMTPEAIADLRALVGMPVTSLNSREIAASYVEDIALYQMAVALYGEEPTRGFTRVVGALVASLMEAGRELAWSPKRDVPMTELEVALANDANMQAARFLPDMIGHLFRERAGRDIWIEEEIRLGPVQMGVAFVDLVGSTNWTAQVPAEDHAAALNRFEEMAVRAAGAHGSRVVKFIGDEAMLVGRDPAGVAAAAAELRAGVMADPVLPGARGTVGFGRVTPRAGDYFGDIVNLVARATKEAGGDALMVTPDVAAALDPSTWIVGTQHTLALKGIATPFDVIDVERKT